MQSVKYGIDNNPGITAADKLLSLLLKIKSNGRKKIKRSFKSIEKSFSYAQSSSRIK